MPTYDKKPQMSAPEVTDKLLAELADGDLDFVVVNYANADMVGHSGVLEAAIARGRDGRRLPRAPRARGARARAAPA